ncbi:MAG: aminopeptidase P family protein [Acidobacteria bacterium]|nr:aminopeptidase P family protein [Acidobacteriota bacterium]
MTYIPSQQVFEGHGRSQYHHERPSQQEFQRRHEKIRKFMEEMRLDCLLIAGGTGTWDRCWNNTRWAVGHVGCQLTNYSYVVFPLKSEPSVLAFPMIAELPARRSGEVVEDVRAAAQADVAAVQRIKEVGCNKGTIGVVETELRNSIPVNHYQTFCRELPEAKLKFVTRDWWKKVRLIRSDEEIAFLERAALIGDAMNRSIPERICAGMTERDVFACLSETMVRSGGEIPSMILVASGSTFSPYDTYQRERPIDRVLGPGDVILTELAPRCPDGSECQTGRTYVIGEASREYQKMAGVVRQAYDNIADQLRPGKTDRDILKAGQVIRDEGYIWYSPLVHGAEGGGVGSLPFVAPGVPLPEEEPFVLKPNMVIVIEAHVERKDHSGGVFLADTWVVTEGEPRCLNRYRRDPLILMS